MWKKGYPNPIPEPSYPPAQRKDLIGKVHIVIKNNLNEKGEITSRNVITFDKRFLPTKYQQENLRDGRLVPAIESEYTYDPAGREIEEKTRKAGDPEWMLYRHVYKDDLLESYQELSPRKGVRKRIKLYKYGSDRKKTTAYSLEAFDIGSYKTEIERFYVYHYEGDVEVERTYSDKAMTKLVAQTKCTYDTEGRVIREEFTQQESIEGKMISTTTIWENHYSVFFRWEDSSETTKKDADGKVLYHSLEALQYTKYNAQGLPIAAVEIGSEGSTNVTFEYTYY